MTTLEPRSFTGRARRRKTKRSVKIVDALARLFITIGGFGTIIAVSTVCIFLVAVVVPMFFDPKVDDPHVVRQAVQVVSDPLHVAVDDYNLMGWAAFRDGTIQVFSLETGEQLDLLEIPDRERMTAWSFPQRGDQVAFGYADGTIRLGAIGFELSFINVEDAPEHLRGLAPLQVAHHKNGLAQLTRERQIRFLTLKLELGDPIATGSESPIMLLDHTGSTDRPILASLGADNVLRINQVRIRRNMMTGRSTYSTTGGELALEHTPKAPSHLKLSGLGDNVYLVWSDGTLQRYDTRTPAGGIFLVEQLDLIDDPATELTSIAFLIGKTTILVGDSRGNVNAWFRTRPEGADTADAMRLTRVNRMEGDGAAAVTTITSSQRKRMIAVGHADGRVRMHNVTNQRFLLEAQANATDPVATVVLSPRDNGLIALAGNRVWHWSINVPHPEVSIRAIFGKVWYEGADKPAHVWQSTGGTDDFESKYGLVPLIFGTIKATFYSMLFGVPLALLAAIYTSEFLHKRVKSMVKPTVEMMASLPSVVLGFLAGLVVAPFIEDVVPTTLAALITIPFSFLLASYVWQMLPSNLRVRLDAWRLGFITVAIPLGIYLAMLLGPLAEAAFFKVDFLDPATGAVVSSETSIRTWLSARNAETGPVIFASSAVGGWFILFLPLSALLIGLSMTRLVNPHLMGRSTNWSWAKLASADLVKFAIGAAATVVVALALSSVFSLFWDARGSYIDTYVQRNALIVGFIMGFAIIPIIYTIADDAMSAVPEHLRSASLGAGATRWQTAIRIIIPTAMSGLFSAVMIGFGRAVGETMIVLMAAGNTPVLEWNMFNGFRTLSANIAVEMSEAVQNSTNYRMLFLAALTLFTMTFIVNTVAETVRLRYRKRAFQL